MKLSRITLSLLGAAVALGLAAPSAFAASEREGRAAAEPAQPVAAPEASSRVPRIADQRPVDIKLNGGQNGFAPNTIATIKTADAAFIKVHFDNFNLPNGVTLEV